MKHILILTGSRQRQKEQVMTGPRARTGRPGDRVILVVDLSRVAWLRTGQKQNDAV